MRNETFLRQSYSESGFYAPCIFYKIGIHGNAGLYFDRILGRPKPESGIRFRVHFQTNGICRFHPRRLTLVP